MMFNSKKILLGLTLMSGLQIIRPASFAKTILEKGGTYLAGAALGGVTVFSGHYLIGTEYKQTIKKLEEKIVLLQKEIEEITSNKNQKITGLEKEVKALKTALKEKDDKLNQQEDEIKYLAYTVENLKEQKALYIKQTTVSTKENSDNQNLFIKALQIRIESLENLNQAIIEKAETEEKHLKDSYNKQEKLMALTKQIEESLKERIESLENINQILTEQIKDAIKQK